MRAVWSILCSSLIACSGSAPSLPQRTSAAVSPSVTPIPVESEPSGTPEPSARERADDETANPRQLERDASAPGFSQPTVGREHTVVRVLLYHSIGSATPRPGTKTHELEEQLELIEELGIEVIRLSQLLDFLDGELELPRHAVVLTIDDGEKNGFSVAYPVFKERGLPFALGLATDAVEQYHSRGAVTWEDVRQMLASGLCELASHSVTHRFMTALRDDELKDELQRSREIIETETGFRPEAFFYPLGAHDRRVRRAAKNSGYRAAFVAHGGPTTASTTRFRIPRYDVKASLPLRTFKSFFNHEIPMSRSSRAGAIPTAKR